MPLLSYHCGSRISGTGPINVLEKDESKARRLLSKSGPRGECICQRAIGKGQGQCDCRVEEVRSEKA